MCTQVNRLVYKIILYFDQFKEWHCHLHPHTIYKLHTIYKPQQPNKVAVNGQQSTAKTFDQINILAALISTKNSCLSPITTMPEEHISLWLHLQYVGLIRTRSWNIRDDLATLHTCTYYVPMSKDPSKKTNLVAMNSLEGQGVHGRPLVWKQASGCGGEVH